uniref:unspecific monooxygenase n=1 Tax=Pundamilia nyererei TaxID=303518 RepID=A0A3B4H0P9_9CICH
MGYFFFLSWTWTLLAALVTLLFVYSCWTYGTFKRLGVPGPSPIPFFGTMLAYRKVGYQPTLYTPRTMSSNSSLVFQLQSYLNSVNFRLNGPLYDAVSIAEDDQWRRIRSVLSPSFTSGRLKEKKRRFISSKSAIIKVMFAVFVWFCRFFGPYSMDVVTSTAFSVDIDSLNNPSDPFVMNIKKMLKFDLFSPIVLTIAFFPFMIPILEKLEFSFFPASVTDFFYAALQKIKIDREGSKQKTRVDFLQLMIDSQQNNDSKQDKGLTDHEILSQAMTFLFAGYETTSSSLTFLSYNLATNPQVMKKLQEEVDATFPNKAPIQYQELMQMEYLDCVINESLRLFPIASRLERVAKASVEINGFVIPKGMVVVVPTWPMHRDPEIWPEPEKFKPERFSKENKETIDPYSYMPFGAGPRNCIGMRFALVVMKLAIVEILQRYSFSVCKETEVRDTMTETVRAGAALQYYVAL